MRYKWVQGYGSCLDHVSIRLEYDWPNFGGDVQAHTPNDQLEYKRRARIGERLRTFLNFLWALLPFSNPYLNQICKPKWYVIV